MASPRPPSMASSAQKKRPEEPYLPPNAGNPVFSCMMPPREIGPKPQSILFKTTSGEYGALPPTYETAPCVYYPMTQYFTDDLGKCGMYRNHSLNTELDKSKVYDHPNYQNTL